MPIKKFSKKPDSTPATTDWKSRIKDSSHDVLLAGIGALARARKDGSKSAKSGRDGKATKADFEVLVAEGRKLEPELMESLQKAWTSLKDKSRASMAVKSDGKLQGVFEERVAAVMAKLGLPRAKEIAELNRKVDSLMAKRGTGKKAPAKKAPAKKAAANKAAAKKVVAKKVVAKKVVAKKVVAKKAPAKRAAAQKRG
jgi:poly(hydroxyalkanoate) granule-associated protein